MRTTVEIDDVQLARLKVLAAQRGEKGYSRLINEALKRYLAEMSEAEREERRKTVAALKGSLSDEEADEARRVIRELRENWRTSDT